MGSRGLLDAGVTEEPGVFELTLRVPAVEARVSGCLILTRSPRDLPAQSPAGVILLMAGQGLIEFSSGGELTQYLARWLSDLQSHPRLWATIALNHRQAVLAHSPVRLWTTRVLPAARLLPVAWHRCSVGSRTVAST